MDSAPIDFAKQVHSYLADFIRAADQKAAFLVIASAALLGWLTTQNVAGWRSLVRLGAVALVGFSSALAVWSVKPRQHRSRTGLIAWNGILRFGSSSEYHDAIARQTDGGLRETTEHSYGLADILKRKYRPLWLAVWAFIVGGILTVVLLASNVGAGQRSQSERDTSCGITAQLHGAKILNVFNPNSAEMSYLVTNHSAQDYVLPERFRVMRKTPDSILHGDASILSFPAERFFPRAQTVEFTVWVKIGNVLDHIPTEKEKAELTKRLAGTQAYVLFDENRRCQIDLPAIIQ